LPQNHSYMKKVFHLVLLLFIVSSCTEDVKFNNPAFQGLKDNVFWRATTYKAYTSTTGNIVIEGSLGFEKVILKVPSSTAQTYVLGVDDISVASYANTVPSTPAIEFETGTNKGSGQIVITEYNAENKTISGTFKFNALNNDETDTENPKVSFTEGVFYKIALQTAAEF